MEQQQNAAGNAQQYESGIWLSSLSKPPRFAPSVFTFSKTEKIMQRYSSYNSNVTETCYVWNFGTGALADYGTTT